MATLTSRPGAPGTGSTSRRTGLLIVVAALHVLIVYGLMVATGVVRQPAFVAPIEAVFIPEATQPEQQPEIKIKPEIEQQVTQDQPPPEVQFEEAVTPPSDVPIPASATAIRPAFPSPSASPAAIGSRATSSCPTCTPPRSTSPPTTSPSISTGMRSSVRACAWCRSEGRVHPAVAKA